MFCYRGFLFAQIRPSLTTDENGQSVVDAEAEEQNTEQQRLLDDEIINEQEPVVAHEGMSRQFKRSVGLGLSLFAGMLYGVTFVPVIYIQNHPEDVSFMLAIYRFHLPFYSSEILPRQLSLMHFHITAAFSSHQLQHFLFI